jgi:hypothetical protein
MPINFHSWLVALHVVALCLGLGGALITDIFILRSGLLARIKIADVVFVDFMSKIVALGLVMIWVTGFLITFEMIYSGINLVKNEKFIGKIFIVLLLSLNAFFIHYVILPEFKSRIGQKLFDTLCIKKSILFFISGSVSFSAWITPVILGVAKELNGKVTFMCVINVYLIFMLTFYFIMPLILLSMAQFATDLEKREDSLSQFLRKFLPSEPESTGKFVMHTPQHDISIHNMPVITLKSDH